MSIRNNIVLTPELLKSHIAEVIYDDRIIGGHRVMHCHFKLDNGFIVYGKKPSTSIDPKNFDEEKAKQISYGNTFDQLWELEAYRALIERDHIEKATHTAEIDIHDFCQNKGKGYVMSLGPNDQYMRGFVTTFLFKTSNPLDPGISANFYQTDNQEYDYQQREKTTEEVKAHILSWLTPEDLNSELVLHIAKICHEANREYCKAIGDDSQLPWAKAPAWQRDSACNGVKFHLMGDRKPSDSHDSWMKQKADEGWVYGPVKDPEKKEHPCMVPFEKLPMEQRVKDIIFKSIVDSFK